MQSGTALGQQGQSRKRWVISRLIHSWATMERDRVWIWEVSQGMPQGLIPSSLPWRETQSSTFSSLLFPASSHVWLNVYGTAILDRDQELLDFLTRFSLYLYLLAQEFAMGRIPFGVPIDQLLQPEAMRTWEWWGGYWGARHWTLILTFLWRGLSGPSLLQTGNGMPGKSHWWAPSTAAQNFKYCYKSYHYEKQGLLVFWT